MRWAQISVKTPADSAEAVSAMLFESGSPGVSESGDSTRTIIGFLPVSDQLMITYERLEDRMAARPEFGLPTPIDCTLTYRGDEEWADAWKKHWKPVEFGKRLVIKPSWETYDGDPDRLIVELDPGMAFGTGGHPTPSLCLVALEDYLKPGDVVADIGTGSGILALAAAKLGAARVHATDIDKLPRDISRENVAINRVEDVVVVHEMDAFDLAAQDCDVIVANILASTVVELLPSIATRINPGGVFIGSGIVEEKLQDVLDALPANGFDLLEVRSDEIWRAVIAQRWKPVPIEPTG